MERWDLPYDNGTHLVIDWRNDRRVSGMNVSSYEVTVHTSLPILNWFVGIFGSFPQDEAHAPSCLRFATFLLLFFLPQT